MFTVDVKQHNNNNKAYCHDLASVYAFLICQRVYHAYTFFHCAVRGYCRTLASQQRRNNESPLIHCSFNIVSPLEYWWSGDLAVFVFFYCFFLFTFNIVVVIIIFFYLYDYCFIITLLLLLLIKFLACRVKRSPIPLHPRK